MNYTSSMVLVILASKNVSSPDLDQALEKYVYSYSLDIILFFIYQPISIFGVFGNFISLFVLMQKEFNIPLYNYLRIHSINSFANNLVSLIYSYTRQVRFIRIIFPNWAKFGGWYACYIFSPTIAITYTYSSALDIILILDRIARFNNNLKSFYKISSIKISIIVLIICVFMNIVFFSITNLDWLIFK